MSLGSQSSLLDYQVSGLAEAVTGELALNSAVSLVTLAKRVGASVQRRELPLSLWGLTVRGRDITVNTRLTPARQEFALAHEIGHVLVRVEHLDVRPIDEEQFTDEFARVLTVGARLVRARLRYQCEPWLVAWQAMLACDEVRVEQFDDVVVCSRCGPRPRAGYCACHPRRIRSPR
jgi:hypothetical protein